MYVYRDASSVLQCVAVCCSMLQYVAVLQCLYRDASSLSTDQFLESWFFTVGNFSKFGLWRPCPEFRSLRDRFEKFEFWKTWQWIINRTIFLGHKMPQRLWNVSLDHKVDFVDTDKSRLPCEVDLSIQFLILVSCLISRSAFAPSDASAWRPVPLRVEFWLKTDSGYPMDAEDTLHLPLRTHLRDALYLWE